jgi:hypothetical protein
VSKLPWLVGCEYSATVRKALERVGNEAWSCDILPTEGDPAWHIVGDVRDAIASKDWGGIILHLPCTAMAVCGNSTYGRGMPKHHERIAAIRWSADVVRLALSVAPKVALENPASVIFPVLRDQLRADVQYIQPYEFGHMEQKKTGLALWGLPRLIGTKNVRSAMMELPRNERERVHYMSPGPDRAKERARFYQGFAFAMGDQWGGLA